MIGEIFRVPILVVTIILPQVLFAWYLDAGGIRAVTKQVRTGRMPQS